MLFKTKEENEVRKIKRKAEFYHVQYLHFIAVFYSILAEEGHAGICISFCLLLSTAFPGCCNVFKSLSLSSYVLQNIPMQTDGSV